MKEYTITVNGTPYHVVVEDGKGGNAVPSYARKAPLNLTNNTMQEQQENKVDQVQPAKSVQEKETPSPTPKQPMQQTGSADTTISAPMPGKIISVAKGIGDLVKEGEVLAVLEAMKMENDIVAPVSGEVVLVSVAQGDSVETGQVIFGLK